MAMKISALALFILVFNFTGCKINQTSEFSYDKDGAWTTKNIIQSRDMTQYDQGGYFWGRSRFGGTFGNEKDKLEGEKKVRDFIWQHWTERKRGYIKFIFAGTDTSRTTHYFIEPNEKVEWVIVRKIIFEQSDGKF